jgi:serine/threonine protein kinase
MLFEWADGGNLVDFWMDNPQPQMTPETMKQTVMQFRGLAGALCAAHNYGPHTGESGISLRHGDLKPENLLRFQNDSTLGTLKIGDWGLARDHHARTALRQSRTQTRYGTRLYEPPEIWIGLSPEDNQDEAPLRISRLYDVWSITHDLASRWIQKASGVSLGAEEEFNPRSRSVLRGYF